VQLETAEPAARSDARNDDDKPGLDLLAFVERLKVRSVIRDQNAIAGDSVSCDTPIDPGDPAYVDEVIGFEPSPSRLIDKSRAQTLVDEKPHYVSVSASGTCHTAIGGRLRHGCLRGRPRSGCAAA